ncbi:MAG: sigma-70 family RNA polymerase sigma factor [Planctomycetaceae bacterium]|nr:sigma-70 family RNA polymerase sigma factor [Planctomycetaceae bacterium]
MDSAESFLEAGIRRFRPVLVTLAEALISPSLRAEIDASDLVQQTLMEAHQQEQVLNSIGEGPFFSWLRNALRHNVLDAVRHLKTQKNEAARRVRAADIEDSFIRLEQLLIADDTSPSERIQRNEQIALLLAAVQELPDGQKEAVMLKHLRGFSLQQVAEALGLSEPAAAGLLHRGRRQLVQRLEKHRDE